MEKASVVLHGNEWPLADIREDIEWCKTQRWVLTQYDQPHDHAHCSVCWWSICVSNDPQVGVAYASPNGRWLCQECHAALVHVA
jgi:hypothetical protein